MRGEKKFRNNERGIHLYVRGICGCTHDLAWNPEIVEKISLRT